MLINVFIIIIIITVITIVMITDIITISSYATSVFICCRRRNTNDCLHLHLHLHLQMNSLQICHVTY